MEWVFAGLRQRARQRVDLQPARLQQRTTSSIPARDCGTSRAGSATYPTTNVGPDGESRGFLTTLHTLHANTGYLVKLKEGTSGTVTVKGKPVPGHPRWALDAHNLAGFPLPLTGGITVGAVKAASPITDIRGLTSEGAWTSLADAVA